MLETQFEEKQFELQTKMKSIEHATVLAKAKFEESIWHDSDSEPEVELHVPEVELHVQSDTLSQHSQTSQW